MKKKKLCFLLMEKPWVIRLLTKKQYVKKHGKNSVAITHINKRRIDLGPKGQDLETITHELVHAYLGELCTHSTDLDDDNLEEIFAEMMAKRGFDLLELAEDLHHRIRNGG